MGGRGLAPLELPGGFWSRVDVGQALVEQEVGELFRLIAKYAGASQTQIGIAAGMSQGQVCMIIAGTRHVRAIGVVERVLDGLNAPDAARLAFGLAPRGLVAGVTWGAVPTPHATAANDHTNGLPAVGGFYPGHALALRAFTDAIPPSLTAEKASRVAPDATANQPGHTSVPGVDSPEDVMARSRRLGSSNIDEARLGYLERVADTAILSSERRSPFELLPYVRDTRRWLDELLSGNQHPRQRHRLYVTAVKLSGLLGSLALDLGRWESARAYGAEAYEMAEFLELPDLQAWARATQSLIEYYAGNFHDALAYAQDGQRLAPRGPQSVRLAVNGEARALARLGNVHGVDEAVGRGFELLHALPMADGVSPSLSLDVYCEARAAANAATAYLIVQRPAEVQEHAGIALVAFDAAGLRAPQALSRLDQATALLMGAQADPERACSVLGEALSYVAHERFESVIQRAQEFIALAQPWQQLPAVRQARELVESRIPRPALESSGSYHRHHGGA